MPFLAVHRQEAAILVCSVVGEDGMEQAEAIIQVSEKNTTTNPIAQILAATRPQHFLVLFPPIKLKLTGGISTKTEKNNFVFVPSVLINSY